MSEEPDQMPAPSIRGRSALVGLLLVAVTTLLTGGTAQASSVPYTDPAATGTIGLCDVQGQNVTSGHVTDKPFVWLAVGATAANASLGAAGRTAFLAAYQPRKGVDPSEWSGEQLEAASRYSNASHPMAQATPVSSTLRDFLAALPAGWNGFVQLRLVLGGSDRAVQTQSYDATDIQVTGSTWHVVRGGSGPCGAGSAVNTAVLLHLPGAAGTPAPGAVASPPGPAATGGHGTAEAVGIGGLAAVLVAAALLTLRVRRQRGVTRS